MLEILTVCTGNVCRSPLAAMILREDLEPFEVTVASAGSRALVDEPLDAYTAQIAERYGITDDEIDRHQARWLNESHLASPDLVLAMARDHRRAIVELAPAKTRTTFTIREFARLSHGVTDAEAQAVADAAGADPASRLSALLGALAARRSEVEPPADAADDDVVDPYRRSAETYEQMWMQLLPALAEVTRIVTIAAS